MADEEKLSRSERLKQYTQNKMDLLRAKRDEAAHKADELKAEKEKQRAVEKAVYDEEYRKERVVVQRAKAKKAAQTDNTFMGRVGRIGARISSMNAPAKRVVRTGRKVRPKKGVARPRKGVARPRKGVSMPRKRAVPITKTVPIWERDGFSQKKKGKKNVPIWER